MPKADVDPNADVDPKAGAGAGDPNNDDEGAAPKPEVPDGPKIEEVVVVPYDPNAGAGDVVELPKNPPLDEAGVDPKIPPLAGAPKAGAGAGLLPKRPPDGAGDDDEKSPPPAGAGVLDPPKTVVGPQEIVIVHPYAAVPRKTSRVLFLSGLLLDCCSSFWMPSKRTANQQVLEEKHANSSLTQDISVPFDPYVLLL